MNMSTNEASPCQICLEQNVVLLPSSVCQHSFCHPCWNRWLCICEQKGATAASPTCPTCRTAMTLDGVQRLLGRPFQPTVHTSRTNEPMDELTRQALQSMDARSCPNCAAWIVRGGGCHAMQCLCGQRLCMTCGQPVEARCPHLRTVQWFDNVTGLEGRHDTSVVADRTTLSQNLRVYLRYRRLEASPCRRNYRQFRETQARRHKGRLRLIHMPFRGRIKMQRIAQRNSTQTICVSSGWRGDESFEALLVDAAVAILREPVTEQLKLEFACCRNDSPLQRERRHWEDTIRKAYRDAHSGRGSQNGGRISLFDAIAVRCGGGRGNFDRRGVSAIVRARRAAFDQTRRDHLVIRTSDANTTSSSSNNNNNSSINMHVGNNSHIGHVHVDAGSSVRIACDGNSTIGGITFGGINSTAGQGRGSYAGRGSLLDALSTGRGRGAAGRCVPGRGRGGLLQAIAARGGGSNEVAPTAHNQVTTEACASPWDYMYRHFQGENGTAQQGYTPKLSISLVLQRYLNRVYRLEHPPPALILYKAWNARNQNEYILERQRRTRIINISCKTGTKQLNRDETNPWGCDGYDEWIEAAGEALRQEVEQSKVEQELLLYRHVVENGVPSHKILSRKQQRQLQYSVIKEAVALEF